jgi:hypothetical protein
MEKRSTATNPPKAREIFFTSRTDFLGSVGFDKRDSFDEIRRPSLTEIKRGGHFSPPLLLKVGW